MTCHRWTPAGAAWTCRHATARVDDAVLPAATAAVHSAAPVGFSTARTWHGGNRFSECGWCVRSSGR